jgi:mannose-6-phosphate isomerase-like protein (cupin superfamily)
MSESSFEVQHTKDGMQTAVMRLERGEESGPLGNEHAQSAQVIVVVRGEIEGQIGEERVRLRAGDSALVPKGVPHRFVGASDERAVTINVYTPPAY